MEAIPFGRNSLIGRDRIAWIIQGGIFSLQSAREEQTEAKWIGLELGETESSREEILEGRLSLDCHLFRGESLVEVVGIEEGGRGVEFIPTLFHERFDEVFKHRLATNHMIFLISFGVSSSSDRYFFF